jgi:ribosomal-protein-alanine N-acetyltransferase
MMDMMARLFTRSEPVFSEAGPHDAPDIAMLHAASFSRGWSEDEFERMLLDRSIVGHRAKLGQQLVGFVLSRLIEGEAEILSVAVAPFKRSRGLGGLLLNLHLRRLAGLGAQAVFLEVDEDNAPACRLYARAGFREIGRRKGYYARAGEAGDALVLRRDLG